MIKKFDRNKARRLRHRRALKNLRGTIEKPRLSVFRSLKHMYVQIINDDEGKTLYGIGTVAKGIGEKSKSNLNKELLVKFGKKIAEECLKRNIKQVVFDRNGFKYHGRIKTLADSLRAEGLAF